MLGSIRIWRFVALLMCVIIAATALIAPGPNSDIRSAVALHDYGHVIAFGIVTALLAFVLDARSRPTFQAREAAIMLATGAAVALGAAVEIAQALGGRWVDPWDILRDSGGALSAALTLTAIDHAVSARARIALAICAVLILTIFAYPAISVLRDESLARSQFPVLVGFETNDELSRFYFSEETKARIVQTTGKEGHPVSAMQLRLPRGKYSGFNLRYFLRDWRDFRALRLHIFNPEPMPLEMAVRIDDFKYNNKIGMSDRYNRTFSILMGINQIEIPLSEVASAPHERRFDLERVQSLLVYAVDLEHSRDVIIGPIVLMR